MISTRRVRHKPWLAGLNQFRIDIILTAVTLGASHLWVFPIPYTLHATPCTQHPELLTLHPAPMRRSLSLILQ